jgi:hypothetical protein
VYIGMFVTLGDGFTVASIEAAHAAAAAAAKTDASQSSQQRAQSGREEGKWLEWVKPGLVLDFAQRCGFAGVIRFSCPLRLSRACLVKTRYSFAWKLTRQAQSNAVAAVTT